MANRKDLLQGAFEAKPLLSHSLHYVVSAGFTSSGLTIGNQDSITVLSGGVASSTVVSAGGGEYISAGGTAVNDTIFGGYESIAAGGVASDGTIYSGEIDGPGVVEGLTISGGVVSGVVFSGDNDGEGGSVDNATVSPGGTFGASLGAVNGLLVSGSGAALYAGGGPATLGGIVVESGGVENLNGGFTEGGTTLSYGGLELVAGGCVASNTVISNGGALSTTLNGSAADAVVLSGGTDVVGGMDSGAEVSAGGVLELTAGGSVETATISSGGTLDLVGPTIAGSAFFLNLPTAVTTVVSNVSLEGGANLAMENPTIDGGGELVLGAGTFTGGATVSSGGVLAGPGELKGQTPSFDYGTVSGVALGDPSSGQGELFVESGGVASGVVELGAADYLAVDSGGAAVDTHVTGAQALFVTEFGGSASGTIVTAKAAIFGVASGTQVSRGGGEYVEAGGATQETDVLTGGGEYVSSGGVATSAVVGGGGVLWVSGGGRANGGVVEVGGAETILAGGGASWIYLSGGLQYDYARTSHTVIRSGGQEVVERTGKASGTVISSGGRETVTSDGVAEGTTISSGGSLVVSSGGLVSGGLTIEGGIAMISGTVSAGQTVRFSDAPAELELDNLVGFHAQISGMVTAGRKVDLTGFTYSSTETAVWAQSGASGTLTVTDGAKAASLNLIGGYVTGDFHLSNDGAGGTFVYEQPKTPAALPATTRFAEAMAGFHDGRDTGLVAVHAGGGSIMGAAPLVAAATSGR